MSLVDQPFASKNNRLFCADCHDNNFAARCDGCGGLFRAGSGLLVECCGLVLLVFCGVLSHVLNRIFTSLKKHFFILF